MVKIDAQTVTERLFVRLSGDPVCGPESSSPPGTLRAGHVHPRLRGYVDNLLAYREVLGPGEEVEERVLPDGAVRLSFNWGDAPSAEGGPGLHVEAIGATSSPALVRLSGCMEGITVTLRPGAAFALLGVPAGELEGTAVDLDTLWRGEASRLLECLAAVAKEEARFELLNEALLRRAQESRLQSHKRSFQAAALAATSRGPVTVKELAAAVGVGERRLQQLFHLHVGLSPRSWMRLRRLERCLRLLRRSPYSRWAELAAQAGYYDQAHLTNEFRALSGLTPTAFLNRAASGSSKTTP